MSSGQVKAFDVGVLLCRNDLYKNGVRYTLLWPLNNFMKYAELHSTLQALADFQGVLVQLNTDQLADYQKTKISEQLVARTLERKQCISSYRKISSQSSYKTSLFLHICV